MSVVVRAPGYWMNEISGVLRPAVEAYLAGGPMTGEQIAAVRAYLRQWIAADGFIGPAVVSLRETVGEIASRADVAAWLSFAVEAGCDPL